MGIGQIAVVDLVGVFRQFALEFDFAGIVEDAQLDLGGVGGNSAKFTPRPSQVAPSGKGRPSRILTAQRAPRLGFFGLDMIAPKRLVRITDQLREQN